MKPAAGNAAASASRGRFGGYDLRSAMASTALATGVLMGVSLWPANEALATCVDVTKAANTVSCNATKATTDTDYDVTAGGNANDRDDRHYLFSADGDVEVTVTKDGVISGFGLAVTTSEPGADINMAVESDGTDDGIVVATVEPVNEAPGGALALTTDGGDISLDNAGVVVTDLPISAVLLTTGGGTVTVNNSSTLASSNGSGLVTDNTGDVSITNTGTVVGNGAGSSGIHSSNINSTFTLDNDDGVIVGGLNGVTVNAVNEPGADAVIISNINDGVIVGSDGSGLNITDIAGHVVIDNDADSVIVGNVGIFIQDVSAGHVLVNNADESFIVAGSGGGAAIDISQVDAGANGLTIGAHDYAVAIFNDSSTITSSDDFAIRIDNDDPLNGNFAGNVFIQNRPDALGGGGTINGEGGISIANLGSHAAIVNEGIIAGGGQAGIAIDNVDGTSGGFTFAGVDYGVAVDNDGGIIVSNDAEGVLITNIQGNVLVSNGPDLFGGGTIRGGTSGVEITGVAGDIVVDHGAGGHVEGDDDGFVLGATGAGNVSLASSGTVTGTAGDGIRTSAVDGDTVISALDTVLAGQHGIHATTASGDIEITASEIGTDADPVGGHGILATSTATGDSDIAIVADSVDAGASAVRVDIQDAANTGDVSVMLLDGADLAGGVWAQSGAGSASVVAGNNVTIAGNSPGSASITAGGDATQLFGNNAMVTGSSGIVVDQMNPAGAGVATVQVGANGTIVGDGSDATDGYNGNGIFAGNRGTGLTSVMIGDDTSVTGDANGIVAFQTNAANANDITITTNGPVQGDGNTSFSLLPYTQAFEDAGLDTTGLGIGVSNAGSGTIIVTTNDTVSGANVGIQTLTTGIGNTTITANETVTGGDDGILASATGAGDITVTANAVVTGTNGDGIVTSANDGDTTITANASVSGGEDGIDASASGAGAITVTTNAAVSGVVDGIVTSANNDDTTITANADVTGGTDGIDASATGTGAVAISTVAGTTVEGTAGNGIAAETASGGIAIDADATVRGGNDGIHARSTSGDITITGSGDITGVAGDGIDAASTAGGSIDVNVTGAVTGDPGIVLSVVGAGTIDLVTGGPVEGTVFEGILTTAVDGDTTITTNGTVTGNTDGIDATATGAGDITVTANAAVTGTNGDGIVTSANTGATTIIANASVSGGDDGIEATSAGGAIAVTSNAAVTGGANGILVDAGGGAVAITANGTVTGNGGDGINASGGAVAISTDAAVTGTDDGIEASGSTVTVAFADTVTGSDDGIRASGTGDVTVTGSADVTGGSGDGINAASTGGNVDVEVTGDVTGARGIVLSATGAGTVDLLAGGTVEGTVGDGINTSAENGATTITANGTVTGAEDGIEAQSTGGAVTVTSNAAVTGGANGILVDAGGGAVAITANGAVTGNGGDGINASGGAVAISTGAAVTGTDDGIEASGSTVTIAFADTVSGGDDGIRASGTGDVTVTGSGNVTGGSGDGINAASTGGNVDVEANGNVTGARGIALSATGAGTVDLLAGGTVEGTAGDGINTSAENGATTITANGTVTGATDGIEAVSTGGPITMAINDTVTGSAGDGIRTRSVDGDTTISVDADVTGQDDGIDAAATGAGDIGIAVAENVTVRGLSGSGVEVATNTGTATVTNSGLVEGASEAIRGATNALIEIFNNAAGTLRNIGGAPDDVAIETTGATNIVNDGLIVGRVNTGAGNDTFINRGGLAWETRGTSDFGAGSDTMRNEGRIVVAHDPAASETTEFDNLETFVNASTGIIDMVEGSLGDPGAGNDPGTRDTLIIDGAYVGEAGSEIEMDVALTIGRNPQTDSDLVVLDPANPATGTSDLVFNIVTTGATATTENTGRATFAGGQILATPVTVVENRGALTTTSGDGPVPLARSGLLNYDLISAGGDFQIVSQLDESLAGGLLLPIPATLAAVALTSQKSPTPITAGCIDPAAKQSAQAGWARGHGGEFRTQTEGTQVTGGRAGDRLASDNETRFFTLQGGFDTVFCDFDGIGGNLHLGVTVGNTWGDSVQRNDDPASGIVGTDVDFETFFVGPYAAYSRDGFAILTALRFDDHELELTNAALIPGKLKVDGDGISGSASASYDINVAPMPVAPRYQLILTPEVGVNVSRTRIDDFDVGGGTVELDDLWSVLGHFGVTGRTTIMAADDLFVTPFASGTVYREFITDAESQFVLGGETVDVEGDRVGTYGQVGIGVNAVQLGDVAAGQPTYFGGGRVDMQFGERLQGFTASLYGRIQF